MIKKEKDPNMTARDFTELVKLLRKDILRIAMQAGEGHIASALSCVDILAILYFHIMNVDPRRPDWTNRDRFILSKGHACSALYAVLARRGFFSVQELTTMGQKGSIFGGHPDRDKVPGIEISTGSLGHGLSVGAGMALAAKRDKQGHHVFVVLGDGECQEGTIWEAAMFAPTQKLDNLVVVVDHNKLQAIDHIENVIDMSPFAEKWRSFGWQVKEINGHDHEQLMKGLSSLPFKKNTPSLIIAHTVKGKGVSFMENKIMWHARVTTDEEFKQALHELDGKTEGKKR